jgi:hypothetical protein
LEGDDPVLGGDEGAYPSVEVDVPVVRDEEERCSECRWAAVHTVTDTDPATRRAG